MKKSQNLFDKLDNIAKSNGLESFTNSLKLEINDSKVSIALLGEFSSGKSTLVNSFLGKNILPALEKPTSSSIVEIIAGDELKAIYQKNNEFGEIDFSDLEDYLMGDKSKEIDKVILEVLENDFIHKGIKIIDTPGISSINNIHDDITFGYLPFIDASIIVLDINQGTIPISLKNFIKEKVIKFGDSKVIFVLNKSDTVSKQSSKNILEEVKKELLEIIKNPIVVSVSAKQALEGNIENSNINELKEALEINVIKNKEQIQEERHVKVISSKVKELIDLLSQKYNALSIDNSELDIKVEESNKSLEKIEFEKRKFENTFDDFKSKLSSYIKTKSDIYAPILIDKGMSLNANNKETIDEFNRTIDFLVKDISNYVLLQSSSFLNAKVNSDFSNLSNEIKSKIENSLAGFRETINTISPFITGVILASFTGPVGLAVGEVATDSAIIGLGKYIFGNTSKVEKPKESFWSKLASPVSQFVESVDVSNSVLKFGAKKWVFDDVKKQLEASLNTSISSVIQELEIQINKTIQEKYIEPQENITSILNNAKKDKKDHINNLLSIKEKIESDILTLKSI